MTERQITKEEFFANGGYKNRLQWSTGAGVYLKFWTRRK